MEILIHKDGNGQPYVEWDQGYGAYKRAWIRRTTDPDKDWAGVGRYLNVARVEAPHTGPAGNPADFPISSNLKNLEDEQILIAFVTAVTSITGGVLEFC